MKITKKYWYIILAVALFAFYLYDKNKNATATVGSTIAAQNPVNIQSLPNGALIPDGQGGYVQKKNIPYIVMNGVKVYPS